MAKITVTINENPCQCLGTLADRIQTALDNAGLDVQAIEIGDMAYSYVESTMDLPLMYKDIPVGKRRREVREEYARLQGNDCMFCKTSLDGEPPMSITGTPIDWSKFPPGFLKNPIHLQHSHETGLTEGAVHAYCNAYWWQYHGR